MGMDVSGKKPTTEAGAYFRNNVWWWRPLWDYCCEVGSDVISTKIANACHYNDGAGLSASGAKRLAKILRERISDGSCAEYARKHEARLASLPDEICELCDGTGIRPWEGGKAGCNGCGSSVTSMEPGTGKRRPIDASYPFSVENVEEFATFLEGSGGFQVY